jgi:hypothetical protein
MPTAAEIKATKAAARQLFEYMMAEHCGADVVQEFVNGVRKLTGAPAPEPQETADDQARLEAVLAAARSQRASR